MEARISELTEKVLEASAPASLQVKIVRQLTVSNQLLQVASGRWKDGTLPILRLYHISLKDD